jgi:hypothetical protein
LIAASAWRSPGPVGAAPQLAMACSTAGAERRPLRTDLHPARVGSTCSIDGMLVVSTGPLMQ